MLLVREHDRAHVSQHRERRPIAVMVRFHICLLPYPLWAALVAQTVKSLPAIQETQVQSMGWEDPLEKGIATHSTILAWRIPWTEEPGGLPSMESQRVGHD